MIEIWIEDMEECIMMEMRAAVRPVGLVTPTVAVAALKILAIWVGMIVPALSMSLHI
jgi:hypothetical protein